jgi:two-component system CheB/CheR fusion protein
VKALLIDDDPKNLDLETRILSRLGCEVDPVDNARSGLELIAERPYDIAFFDCVMPGMSGTEAVGLIRSGPNPRPCPILALTGAVDGVDLRALGFDDVLEKPISIQEFKDALARWVTDRDR